jgi:hypothetical protein
MGAFISNPLGAYGQDADFAPSTQAVVKEFRSAAALGIGQIVKLVKGTATVADTTIDVLNVDVATANTDVAIGVVVKGSTGAGESVQVCTHGPAKVRASATDVPIGTWFQPTTSGRALSAAVGTVGTRTAVGITLEATGTTADALKFVYVNPSMIFAS